jgi:hypothetical protein
MAENLTLSFSNEVHAALLADAKKQGFDVGIYAVRIIENHLLQVPGLLNHDTRTSISLARELIEQAVATAKDLVHQKGFSPSITFDAIQTVSADKQWLQNYADLVGDDPYKTGNPRKQTINQDLGYFIKKSLDARSVKVNGKPRNVKVKGSIIQSYTELEV